MIKDIKVGDRVRWHSAAGWLRGEIKSIQLARSAADTLIPWLLVEHFSPTTGKDCTTMLRFRGLP